MADPLPLADVKVLDLMWAIAGPAATRVLADYGATVVRIESGRKMDVCRTVGPYHEFPPAAESSVLFHNMNAGKRMMVLDLAKPAGREVFLDLVRWADVLTEAYTPKTMRGWGLDYASLCKVKPDLIMLSTCLMGQTGPLANYGGFGNLAAAISGFANLCGWPDRPPAGPYGAYTDYIAPRFNALMILTALDHRRRTGEGQLLDVSQAEASIHFLGPAILDYTVNGRVQRARGNTDPEMAPHGVYPAAGENRWIAISVRTDAEFAVLCDLLGRSELAQEERFTTAERRLAHPDELDALVAGWTRERDAHELEALLQSRGIAASVAQTSGDLCSDPQLAHRGHFVKLDHPTYGTTPVEGSRFVLSRTPAKVGGSAPTFGRDNEQVLKDILGYDDERITELVIAGALE